MVTIAKTGRTTADLLQARVERAYAATCADLQALGYMTSWDIANLGLGLSGLFKDRLAEMGLADLEVSSEDLLVLAGLAKQVEKKAIPYKKTPLAAPEEAWDGPAEVAAADVDGLKVMCAIVQGDGTKKGDYKLPHHKGSGEHACVLAGVRAAGGVLQGAHGGIDASDAEIAGAKKHLARHYAEFDETPPWEKKASMGGDDGGEVEPVEQHLAFHPVSKPGFDESDTEIRYRVRDPGDFRPDTYRTKKWTGITSSGLSFEVTPAMANSVSMILAKLKREVAEAEDRSPDSMVMQSVRWAKVDKDDNETGWTLAKAKEWWRRQESRKESEQFEKVQKRLYVQILRKNSARQLVTGVVLPCNKVDLQADYVEEEEILDAMVRFMEKSQEMNLMHETPAPQVKVVECWAARSDFEEGGFLVSKGSWLMTVHVIDEGVWKGVESGEYRGFSIEGIARRVPVSEEELPGDVEVTEEARAAALLQAP